MARTANPYTKVIKHLAKLQAKADKLNTEIAAFSKFVETEAKSGKAPASPVKKAAKSKVAPKAKKPSVKKPAGKKAVQKPKTKTASPQKKTPRASKAPKKAASGEKAILRKADGSPDYLAMLNWDGVTEPKSMKRRSTKPKAPRG